MVERVLETFYGSWPLTCGNFLVGKVDQCSGIKQNLHRAITELGKDFEVNVISDKARMANYEETKGPAVVSVNYKLKSMNHPLM